MKRSERRQEDGAGERNVVSTETSHFAYHSTLSDAPGSAMIATVAVRMEKEALKIGRRYSFDDNGGGYQGL